MCQVLFNYHPSLHIEGNHTKEVPTINVLLVDDDLFITYTYRNVCVYICLFDSRLHMETLLCNFFPHQYPFETGRHFLLLRVSAVCCAKRNTGLAFCRFRSRHRRAKYRLTIFTFCSLKTKEIKVISCRLCLIHCSIWDASSSLYDLLFIMKIPCSSPRFLL